MNILSFKENIVYTFLLLIIFFNIETKKEPIANLSERYPLDLLVCGPCKYADGWGRLPIIFLDMLSPYFNTGFCSSREQILSKDDVPEAIKDIIDTNKQQPAKVFLIADVLWAIGFDIIKLIPDDSSLKIAYSMMNTTTIPEEWTSILNNKFDLVVVPDIYLIKVYKKAGVNIPIFCLPIPLYLEDFLKEPVRLEPNQVFTFGMSAGLYHDNKNWEMVIESFSQLFSDSTKVKLKIHTRIADERFYHKLKKAVGDLACSNIEIIHGDLKHQDYIHFMKSLDCYVLLSKGEGFSISPREALALGIPCILTNNTAQKTICSSGFVEAVKSDILEPAYYYCFSKMPVGYHFGSHLSDVMNSMKNVYYNYSHHKERALKGKVWVEQYLRKNVVKKYSMLISPKKIVFSDSNVITEDCLFTSSKSLYNKYINLMKA